VTATSIIVAPITIRSPCPRGAIAAYARQSLTLPSSTSDIADSVLRAGVEGIGARRRQGGRPDRLVGLYR
jgi:hypothetical protein